jgi:hypothetical protein
LKPFGIGKRTWAIAITALVSAAPASPGYAGDDGSIGAFFREQFGIGAAPQPEPQPDYSLPDDHPIIVRPRHKHIAARRADTKVAVGPVAPVSIYDDRTLRPGDAVMTAKGVRVFLGGHQAPYTEADFTALSDTEGLPKQVEKELVVIDKAPRI